MFLISCDASCLPISGENLGEYFAKDVNRFNKLPAISDNGFKLSESVAIFHYLGRKGIIPERWYPKDKKTLSKIDEYLEWNHNNLFAASGRFFIMQLVEPEKTGVKPNPDSIEVQKRTLIRCVDDLENIWLKDNKYLVGDEITFADLVAVSVLMQVVGIHLFELDDQLHAKIRRWIEEVRKYFAPTFDQAHTFVYKFGDKVKKSMKTA